MELRFIDRLFDLEGKVAVVTGGAGALGGLMAQGLAYKGVKVCIVDLHRGRAEQVAGELVSKGYEVMAASGSVLEKDQLEEVNQLVIDRWDKIDILVNAAGGNVAAATLTTENTVFDLPIEAFRQVFDLNLLGTVLPSQVFGATMARQKQGAIVNISSMASSRAITRVVGYSAAKSAVENFTRWMAVELAFKFGEGMRVNALAPGFFVGEQNRSLLLNADGSLTDRGKQIIAHTPMGRFGEANELLGTLFWLCSEASRFVTGIVVPIDGGFSSFSGV